MSVNLPMFGTKLYNRAYPFQSLSPIMCICATMAITWEIISRTRNSIAHSTVDGKQYNQGSNTIVIVTC